LGDWLFWLPRRRNHPRTPGDRSYCDFAEIDQKRLTLPSFFSSDKNQVMNKLVFILSILFLTFSLSSCAAIGEIFKAGVWVGVIIVVAVIALILFLISRGSNKN
jgi:preprotein translocase subunit SecG